MEPLFGDRSKKPTPASLAKALGRTTRHWDAVLDHAEKASAGLVREWKYYGKKYGWIHKLTVK